ncbi:nicF [Symbiodinium sp. KB8]|nr:nicF [Symbiodinium sp. KB8]
MASAATSSVPVATTATVTPADVLGRGGRTLVLMCDVQPAIMAGTFRDSDPAPVLARMAKFLELARAAGVHVGHVAVRFEDGELSKGGWRRVRFLRWLTGHPEVAATSKLFSGVKAAGKLLKSDPATAIDSRIGALATEPVFEKQRVSAHMATSLDLPKFIAENGVDTIVLGGFSTSGVILSTVCWAGDHDIRAVVLEDLCADGKSQRAGVPSAGA